MADGYAQRQETFAFSDHEIPMVCFRFCAFRQSFAWLLLLGYRMLPMLHSLFGRKLGQPKPLVIGLKSQKSLPQDDKNFDQKLVLAYTSLGLTVIGNLLLSPLTWVGMAGVLYLSADTYKGAYHAITTKRKVNRDVLDAAAFPLLLLHQQLVIYHLLIIWSAHRKKIIHRLRDQSGQSIIDIFRQHPKLVWVRTGDLEVEIPFAQLRPADIVVVRAGHPIPVDGRVVAGAGLVDQQILTGEAQPIEKMAGDAVLATTIVLAGCIDVQVEKTGEETTSAQIGRIVNQTADFKPEMLLKTEAFLGKLMLPSLILSYAALPFIGALNAVAILLAVPHNKTAVAGGLGTLKHLDRAARRGILIKDGRAYERLCQVDTVVFDKTGTLTLGQPHVGQIYVWGAYSEDEILQYVAAAEYQQTHPIARAIVHAAHSRGLPLLADTAPDSATYQVGLGLSVWVENKQVLVGSLRFMQKAGIASPAQLHQAQSHCQEQGFSLVLVAINQQIVGAIELHPSVRPEVQEVIQGLRQRQIKSIYILSGDLEAPTRKLATDLGCDGYFAEVLPENKAALIDQLQQEGKIVCYIGDGINDAIALRKATVSISLHGASTVAIDTAGIILQEQGLRELCYLFDQAQQFKHHMTSIYALVLTPCAISLYGALFLDFGLPLAYVLNHTGFLVGLYHAIHPPLVPVQAGKQDERARRKQNRLRHRE